MPPSGNQRKSGKKRIAALAITFLFVFIAVIGLMMLTQGTPAIHQETNSVQNSSNSVTVYLYLLPDENANAITPANKFQVTYTLGGSLQIAYQNGTNPLVITCDPDTEVRINATSSGSTPTELWVLNNGSSATTFNAGPSGGAFTYRYYDLLLENTSYSVMDGGSPSGITISYYGAPTSSGSSDEELQTNTTLDGPGHLTTAWVCRGSNLSYLSPSIAGSAGEAWNATGETSWVIGSADQAADPLIYYHQYALNLSYSAPNGALPTAPILNATLYGNPYAAKLNLYTTSYWCDAGQSWSVTDPLVGSSGSERWISPQATNGGVSGTASTAFTYYQQYYEGFDYFVEGGDAGYGAPNLTYISLGTAGLQLTLTTQPQYVWADAGSTWSLTNPLPGSGSSERCFSGAAFGAVTGAPAINSISYADQYYVTVIQPANGTINQTTGWYDAAPCFFLATPNTGYFSAWYVNGVQYSDENPLSISIDSSFNISAAFMPARVTVSITLLPDSGPNSLSPGNEFLISYTSGGGQYYAYQTGINPLMLACDPDTYVTISGASTGSSTIEEWCLNSPMTPTTFNTGSSGGNFTYYYYDLLEEGASYFVINGGPPAAPILSYFTAPASSGSSDSEIYSTLVLTEALQDVWACRGTTASVTPVTISGDSGERWSSTDTSSWIIDSANCIADPFWYYHQYLYTLSYSVNAGSGYSAPSLISTQFGTQFDQSITTSPTAYWLDDGSAWSVSPNPLVGSNSTVRWIDSTDTLSGTVSSPLTATFAFTYQTNF